MSVLQSDIPPFTVEPRRQIYLGMDPNDRFRRCWASPVESVGVIGPTRHGKSSGVVIPTLLTWDGPVVAVSSRDDLLKSTRHWRARLAARGGGQVHIYDPFGMMPEERSLSWSPLTGCEDQAIAWRRANEMSKLVPRAGGFDAGIVRSGAAHILRATFHAAAISGGSMDDVSRWILEWDFDPVIAILRGAGPASAPWANSLKHLIKPNDWERRIILAAHTCMEAMNHPRGRASMRTSDVDIDRILQTGSTLFVLLPDYTDLVAPLGFSLLDAIRQRANALAARSPTGRLDPPLLIVVDDMINVAPNPSLTSHIDFGGRAGVLTLWTAQSMADLRGRFGGDGLANMLANTTVKLIYGGLSHSDDLSDVAAWAGRLNRREPFLPEEAVQMLPPFHAWLFNPGNEPLLVETRPAELLAPYRRLMSPEVRPSPVKS